MENEPSAADFLPADTANVPIAVAPSDIATVLLPIAIAPAPVVNVGDHCRYFGALLTISSSTVT